MTTQRNDPHRPGAIIPTDYQYLFSYTIGQHHFNLNLVRELIEKRGVMIGHSGSCGVCGAHYSNGDVWKHVPTGEYLHIGYQCADKYSMFADRSQWEIWHRDDKARRAVAIKEERWAKAKRARIEKNAELIARFDALITHPSASDFAKRFATDQKFFLVEKGYMPTDKQLALFVKLEAEAANPKPAEKHVPAPEGRVRFQGEVVAIKAVDSDFGCTIKLVVKVNTPDGSWLVWVTEPGSMYGTKKGETVDMTATLTRGKDAHFVFGKRPVAHKSVA